LGKKFEKRSHFWAKNTAFGAPRDFYTPLGAFFIRIPLGQDRKSVKTNKTGALQRHHAGSSDDIGKHTGKITLIRRNPKNKNTAK